MCNRRWTLKRPFDSLSQVCDTDLRIVAIDPHMPGLCHDSFVWRHSALRRRLTYGLLNDEKLLLNKCSNDSAHFPYVLCRFNTNKIFDIILQIGTLCRAENTLVVSNVFVYLSFIPCISQAFLCYNTFFSVCSGSYQNFAQWIIDISKHFL